MGRFAEGTGTAEINAEPTAAQSDFVLGHRRDLEIIHPGSSIRDNRCEYFILKSCSSADHLDLCRAFDRLGFIKKIGVIDELDDIAQCGLDRAQEGERHCPRIVQRHSPITATTQHVRTEERRVGKECVRMCSYRW